MAFKPYKFQILPVLQEVDGDGNVTNEVTLSDGQGALTVFGGIEGLKEWADGLPALIDELAEREEAKP